LRRNAGASVEGRERLRLFCALLLPDETVSDLVAWQGLELADVPGARVVPPENLHITLAFLGGRPVGDVEPVLEVLRGVAADADALVLTATRYRETRSVGMVVLDDHEARATRIAGRVGKRLEQRRLYERERREWLPHVTVLRFRTRPRLAPSVPDLGRVSPSELALYHSVLRPGGAQYEIVESVALGG
jgi:RNA 2',3'-cyclic 3'-phosphodiesterase